MGTFTKEELLKRACQRVAIVMLGMWEEKGSSDTRLLLPPLIPDDYVIIGESLAGKEYREHVVPRNIICNGCHRMFETGSRIDEVAESIRKHLKIIWISKFEQQRLDQSDQLNLRQRMPPGWEYCNGDTFARLKFANISYELYA